jgi:hypothetical protein
MKITLRKNWDSVPSGLAKPSPYFSGKKKELAQLEHILMNKTSGSILIGAPRGVGKTDLIYQAISNVLSKKSKTLLIPIILNATQINEIKDKEKLPQAIITNLITRTYSVTKGKVSNELFAKVAILYYQATAATYEEKRRIASNNENEERVSKQYEKVTIGKLTLNKKDLEMAIKSLTPLATLSIPFLLNQVESIPLWALITIYFVLFIVTILSQAVDFSIETNETIKNTNQKTISKKIIEEAEILYLRDNSLEI